MKKILVIVTEEFSANGICAKAIMNELVSKNYEVECLTNKENKEVQSTEFDNVKFHYVRPRLSYRLLNGEGDERKKIHKLKKMFGNIINKIKLITAIPTWPLISPLYTYRILRKANKIYKKNAFDMIIPIYSQIDPIIAGHYLKRKYNKIKFVPYFLDSLSGGYGPKIFSDDLIIKRGLKWEMRMLNNSDCIIVMESSRVHHEKYSKEKKYFDQIKFLDIPLLKENTISGNDDSILNNDKINLVYAGSIPCHIRNPKFILDVFNNLRDLNLCLTFIGSNTCAEIFTESLEKNNNNNNSNEIKIFGNLTHLETLNILSQADFLVNIGNNLDNMVPSKIFEYMSFGKPIISTNSIKTDPSNIYLEKYSHSLILDEKSKIDSAVILVEKFIKDNLGVKVNIKTTKQKLRNNTPEAFVEEISKIFIEK